MAKQDYQPPRLTLPVGERDHSAGPSDARMVLVEYGDYQCPYCGAAYPIVKEIQKQLGTKLRFVFRNFPITTSHPQAEWAVEMGKSPPANRRFVAIEGRRPARAVRGGGHWALVRADPASRR